ncbi:MAG: DNA repair protein RecO [Candidatus Latescibacteria bacterium]|nr:DNA repair protein RecO [Candidatus Latescibacterota bacterium]NIM21611.1 DNA repair protein RecO [Candidatus Latescibacterota bacterium]NIM64590.1 DNA repair protein RecO [Candidatus Latescibacterota bacterium]NIO01105.1 DNA repair protein RecO [Candidatus Latescibacterota bacterium]NIO27498.1 DNA repair protein RecO [Candidatus Latescibacterota bacterium]
MLVKDEGIVLKTARSGETSKEVTFLGKQGGKIRLIAKGALGGKSAFRGALEPGNHLEAVYYFKEGRSRYYLKEVFVVATATIDRRSLQGMAATLAALELLDRVCYAGSPDPSLVDVALDFVRCQPVADPLFFFLAFEIKLLEALGALPDLSGCVRCGADVEGGSYDPEEAACFCANHEVPSPQAQSLYRDLLTFASRCLREPLEGLKPERADRKLRKDLGKLIHWTYTYHVQGYTLPESLKLL